MGLLVNSLFRTSKMNTVAIFCVPLHLEITSFGTLAKLVETGNQVHVVVVGNTIRSWTRRCKCLLYESCKIIGVTSITFTESFDYSSVTQNNALILSSIIQKVSPGLVIIPFWKSHNYKLNVLSGTSLIACRGIGNILMYNFSRNSRFDPNICVKLSKREACAKLDRLLEYWPLFNRQMQRKSGAPFYPNIMQKEEKKDSMELNDRSKIVSFLHTRLKRQRSILLNSLNSGVLERGKLVSNKIGSVAFPDKRTFNYSREKGSELSEAYEGHRILLV
jgi:hypothetical protein